MCGFFITNDPNVTDIHEDLIEESLRFRGPDCSSGLLDIGRGWKAYHSRLSIIDIESGVNQPVINEQGTLVFNGEILNFRELGFKYFDKRYDSDTLLLNDLIIHGLLKLSELDGFFSFVFVDRYGNVELAARDRFGVKPLFYSKYESYISFSSEPALLNRIRPSKVDADAVDEYKCLRAPIFSDSYFKDVQQVKPGNCLVRGEYFNCLNYVSKNYKNLNTSEVNLALMKGLESRLISDAPVGLLLSRGVDSHILKSLNEFDRYYSIGFEGDEDIEFLKKKNYKNLNIVQSNYNQYRDDFDYLLKLRGEPMSVPNEVLLYRVALHAAEDGIKVLLSGEGADEFFGGYDRIFQWAAKTDKFEIDTFISLYCYSIPASNSVLYHQFVDVFNQLPELSPFEIVRWFFIRYHMPVLFRRLDFSLMAAGVEGREPIANMHTFVIAMALGPEELMGAQLGKIPLRNVVSSYMGSDFAYESKVGFPVDLTKIFDNENNLTSYELWFEKNMEILK
ncbi:asparagine synthetase B family protein [Vibrio splendidus]|uniref:asparagine synthetase B family protein n=1 Tax=Vibrio splendidus TaxID=29497 RepID=UPI000D3D1254|nr:asparagine synthase-related protein [Vibrio splendidus]PTO68221.1 asparagine synthase [Vibrio splendidus]PTP81875.1 asparagine synthase [Vibrio splendidus]